MGTKISKCLLVSQCFLKKKKKRLVREASERPKMNLKVLQSPETKQMKVDQSTIYRVLYNTTIYEEHKRSHYSKRSV